MTYLYEALKEPTRLYIKQCPHCGLKYFGKTVSQNIEKYPGSGKKWKRHLKKHDVQPLHLWNSDWYYDTSIKRFALKFSRINKIVESKIWANLVEEDGIDGISSDGATRENYRRLEEGVHPFCNPLHNQKTNAKRQETKRKNGTHNFLGGEIQRKRIENGTHHLLSGEIQRKTMLSLSIKGKHPMQLKTTVVDKDGNTFTILKEDVGKNPDLVHPNSLEGKRRLGKSTAPTEKQLKYWERMKKNA